MKDAYSDIPEKNIPIILDKLEHELMDQWKTFSENQPIREVEDFGKRIKSLGEEYSAEVLIYFSDRLLHAIGIFDFEDMVKILNTYPELVEKVKS